MIDVFGSNTAILFRAVDFSSVTIMMAPFWYSFTIFHQVSPRSVRQHSEVVIENVAAMYGAGFSAGNIYISVGHSVHSLPYWGGVLKRMPAVSVFPYDWGGLLTLRATSSTAQGGGGSFKNRKPIGEVGCCESGMAERSHWWTKRCLRSPLFLSLSFSDYLPTYLPIYLSIYLPIYLCIDLSIDLSLSLSSI